MQTSAKTTSGRRSRSARRAGPRVARYSGLKMYPMWAAAQATLQNPKQQQQQQATLFSRCYILYTCTHTDTPHCRSLFIFLDSASSQPLSESVHILFLLSRFLYSQNARATLFYLSNCLSIFIYPFSLFRAPYDQLMLRLKILYNADFILFPSCPTIYTSFI